MEKKGNKKNNERLCCNDCRAERGPRAGPSRPPAILDFLELTIGVVIEESQYLALLLQASPTLAAIPRHCQQGTLEEESLQDCRAFQLQLAVLEICRSAAVKEEKEKNKENNNENKNKKGSYTWKWFLLSVKLRLLTMSVVPSFLGITVSRRPFSSTGARLMYLG